MLEQTVHTQIRLLLKSDLVLKITRGKSYNLGIIFHITPLKCMLRLIIRTVLPKVNFDLCFTAVLLVI